MPNATDPTTVLYEVDGSIVTITLNRPDARNAISLALTRDLVAAFERARADDAIKVIILTGAGQAFCAGVDLKEFGQLPGPPEDTRNADRPVRPDAWAAMAACEKPIIGAINGPAITGGFEIALACDVLIASTEARFADTHGRVGVLPGAGLSQRLSRAIGIYRAKALSLTGDFLSAERASEWGLVSHIVAPAALLPTARTIAESMTELLPGMLNQLKHLIDDGFDRPFAEGMRLESQRSTEQIAQFKPQKGASAAFEKVRDRGRQQKN